MRQPGTGDQMTQPIFISGRVMLEGGNAPPEPIPIERVCNGTVRREGYTDTKGQFQIQLGQNVEFQDASSTDSTLLKGLSTRSTGTAQDALRLQFLGCEFRATLPGFQSSSVSLKMQGSTWQYDVGTIFLKRLAGVQGITISRTTMAAPKNAREAYAKAEKDFHEKKYPDAEKHLNKAVELYPGFAAAWSLLGDVHQELNQLDQASKEYAQSVNADPQYVNPRFGLSLIAVQQKRWPDAVTLTNDLIKLNATAYPSTYFYNAVANFNAGNFDAAEESGRKYKAIDATDHRHPDIYLLLSQVMMMKHNYAAAAQEMRDYLSIRPDAPNAAEIRNRIKGLEEMSMVKPQTP